MGTKMGENYVDSQGAGAWRFQLYKPEPGPIIGPYQGILTVTKDWHTVLVPLENGGEKVLVRIPSQNIAYLIDEHLYAKMQAGKTR